MRGPAFAGGGLGRGSEGRGRLGADLGGARRIGAGRAARRLVEAGGLSGALGGLLRSGSHGTRGWGARLVASGVVAAAVQLGVPRERRAAGPAG